MRVCAACAPRPGWLCARGRGREPGSVLEPAPCFGLGQRGRAGSGSDPGSPLALVGLEVSSDAPGRRGGTRQSERGLLRQFHHALRLPGSFWRSTTLC